MRRRAPPVGDRIVVPTDWSLDRTAEAVGDENVAMTAQQTKGGHR
jgi:hypothetical protein